MLAASKIPRVPAYTRFSANATELLFLDHPRNMNRAERSTGDNESILSRRDNNQQPTTNNQQQRT
ncbi:hypothetical protein [Nitrosomonas sp. Nm84]|uniref:hypothetical protein n=1 Tax=Nitrosomonas sp. Nm84 TaxID=200124 RepID=UPI00104E0568|nr:hypothetical protein [Nitrosomonas sp. Nm84]